MLWKQGDTDTTVIKPYQHRISDICPENSGVKSLNGHLGLTQILSHTVPYFQRRIYVANESPTFVRNMSIVKRKLKILGQIIL